VQIQLHHHCSKEGTSTLHCNQGHTPSDWLAAQHQHPGCKDVVAQCDKELELPCAKDLAGAQGMHKGIEKGCIPEHSDPATLASHCDLEPLVSHHGMMGKQQDMQEDHKHGELLHHFDQPHAATLQTLCPP
jgi:hypothetical protein